MNEEEGELAPAKLRRRRGQGVPLEELQLRYPSLKSLVLSGGKNSWVATFNARPDAMHSLLADYIKQVHAKPGRIGQRPMPREAEVDFNALVFGEENDEPMVVVLPKLMRVSERMFAQQTNMSRSQLQRVLRGEYEPDVNEIRLIAAAVRKPPVYFVEYRKAMAVAAFINLITERPGIATSLYKTYLEVHMGET